MAQTSWLQPIRTKTLLLLPSSVELLKAELESPQRLASRLNATVNPGWPPGEYDRPAQDFFLARMIEGGEAVEGWYCWYALERITLPRPLLIGAGGYFGLPDPEGDVEIGFSVVSERRCLGYGSEIAEALAKRAFLDPRVRRVVAHHAPDNTPSKRALEKSGFRFTGLLTGQGNLEYVYAPSNPS